MTLWAGRVEGKLAPEAWAFLLADDAELLPYDLQALMLRDALQRWVAAPVAGEVEIELRRGDDYTILDTRGESFSYAPERLSMERSATAFSAADRIGQLQVQLNDIADSRRMLEEQRRLRLEPAKPPSDPLELGP